MPGAVAITLRSHLFCGRRDTDVVFNEDHSFSSAMPSVNNTGNWSIGMVALHEFGHVLGLAHCDVSGSDCGSGVQLAVMNEFGVEQDVAGKYRLNEDDYVGLTNAKPDANTGKNLMLQRYHGDFSSPTEVWSADNPSDPVGN